MAKTAVLKSHFGAVLDLFLYANARDWLATGLSSCQSSSLQKNPFPSFNANQESCVCVGGGGEQGLGGVLKTPAKENTTKLKQILFKN